VYTYVPNLKISIDPENDDVTSDTPHQSPELHSNICAILVQCVYLQVYAGNRRNVAVSHFNYKKFSSASKEQS
jgi:hypothetical protein